MIYGFDQNRVFIAGVPYPLPLILLPFYLPPFPYPFDDGTLEKRVRGSWWVEYDVEDSSF